MSKKRKLEDIINAEIRQYNRRKALLFFEMAVGEVMQNYDLDESKKIIQSYLDMINEH